MEDDSRHNDAVVLINQLEKDNVFLYSHLTLLELHEVIRKRTIERKDFSGINNQIYEQLKKESDGIISKIDETFLSLSKQDKMRLATPDKKLSDYLLNALVIFKPIFPDLDSKNWCRICNQNTKMMYKVVGIGHYDLQHAINSKEFLADEIISYDKGFDQLKRIRDFNSIKVTVRKAKS